MFDDDSDPVVDVAEKLETVDTSNNDSTENRQVVNQQGEKITLNEE